MNICPDCHQPINGDHTRENGQDLHLRCARKRVERRPGFIAWTDRPAHHAT